MLSNSIAIVTGAGRGIGAFVARKFAKEGACVVVNDLDAEPAEQMAKELREAGANASACYGNVSEREFAEKILSHTIDAFGAPPTVLVNNAGFTWDGMLHKMTDEQFDAVIECHVGAPFRMARAVGSSMREEAKREIEEQGSVTTDRCIINISSISGLHGNIGQANYAAAKAGIVGLTKTCAKEWGGFGIRSNCVAFGFIDTRMTQAVEGEVVDIGDGKTIQQGMPAEVVKNMTDPSTLRTNIPLGRLGRPEEAADGVLMMASPMSSFITGHVLEVTGAKPTQTYSASKDGYATDTSDDEDDEPTQMFGASATKKLDAATARIPRTQELWDAEGVASAMKNSDNDSDESDDSEVMCEAPDVTTISSTPPSLVSATVRGLSPAEEMDEATNADDGDETQDEDVDDEHVDDSIETKTTAVAPSPPRTRQRKKRSLAVVTKTSMIKIDAKRKKMDSTVDDEPVDKKITSRRLRSSSPKDADVETLARHDVIRICFTGVSKEDASRYEKKIALCGPLCHGIVGSSSIVTDDVADATHLVVYDEKTPEKGYKRTLKLLHGICLLARGT
eukprot:g3620.t1